MYRLAHVKGRENTMDGQNTTEATLLGLGGHEHARNTSTDDTDTKSTYLTAVFQQPVVGDEHDANACMGPHGTNTEISKHGYVEGLCCH